MTSHMWKNDTTGFILDPTDYVDGQAFAPGDTLVVASGRPQAFSPDDQPATLTPGSYLFAGGAAVVFTNVELPSGGILGESSGPQFTMITAGQFVNAGAVDIGSPTLPGSTEVTMKATASAAAGFTNDGQITIQNSSSLRLFPSSSSSVVNAAGATIDILNGSQLVFSDANGYEPGSEDSLVNDGTINVSAPSGGAGSRLNVGANYGGSGTVAVTGTSGTNPTYTLAHFQGAASGNFNVTSGQLEFDGNGPVQGAIISGMATGCCI